MSQAQVSWSATAHLDSIGSGQTANFTVVWSNGPAGTLFVQNLAVDTFPATNHASGSTFWSPHFTKEELVKAIQVAAAALMTSGQNYPLNFPPGEITVLGV
jgi:hypothetical protein